MTFKIIFNALVKTNGETCKNIFFYQEGSDQVDHARACLKTSEVMTDQNFQISGGSEASSMELRDGDYIKKITTIMNINEDDYTNLREITLDDTNASTLPYPDITQTSCNKMWEQYVEPHMAESVELNLPMITEGGDIMPTDL